jgi:hypothetical protein
LRDSEKKDGSSFLLIVTYGRRKIKSDFDEIAILRKEAARFSAEMADAGAG